MSVVKSLPINSILFNNTNYGLNLDPKELNFWKTALTANAGPDSQHIYLQVKWVGNDTYICTAPNEKLQAFKDLNVDSVNCEVSGEPPNMLESTQVDSEQIEGVGVDKVKRTRLSAAQRFQVMKFLEGHKNEIVAFQRLQEVADYVFKELKVVISAQTAGNYLDDLGLPKPGGSVESARITALEGQIKILQDMMVKYREELGLAIKVHSEQADLQKRLMDALDMMKSSIGDCFQRIMVLEERHDHQRTLNQEASER